MINILRRESFNWRRPLFKMEKIVGRWSPQLKKFFTKGEGLNCRSCICIIWNYSTDKANVYPSQGNNTAFKSIVSFCCVGEPFCKTVFLLIRRTVHTCVHLRVCKVCVLTRGVCHKIKKNNDLMWKGKMKSLLWKGKMKSLFLRQKEEGFLQGGESPLLPTWAWLWFPGEMSRTVSPAQEKGFVSLPLMTCTLLTVMPKS